MKKKYFLVAALMLALSAPMAHAQRVMDKLDRGLVAVKTDGGVYCSWRINGEEYFDVKYNLYRDGVKVNSEPLDVSNYTDAAGTATSTYTVKAVVDGKEQEASKSVKAISGKGNYGVLTVKRPKRLSTSDNKTDITDNFEPNDATVADVDGDGEMELLVKQWSKVNNAGYQGPDYDRIEVQKLDGSLLWWIDCGPNLWDFQHNETNIAAYDWDGDGKAECIMRAADGTTIHTKDGKTIVIGDNSKKYRYSGEQFVHEGAEYLIYLNGETGEPYQIGPAEHPDYMEYPLKRLEDGETDLKKAWGDGYGHRSSKNFFGAPYLDGRHPSIFMARGIYTRHKMIAMDVDPNTHKLTTRWRWTCNDPSSPWYGNGYHNYAVADVDWDGRDEIVFGSMVIDDNGKGLSTTGLGHGDAEHVGNYNPYVHGQEVYACNETRPANNYRDATTSKIYYRLAGGGDDGRSMMANFTNDYPGAIGYSGHDTPISSITGKHLDGAHKVGLNFRIYWDGDLLDESLNGTETRNSAFAVSKYDKKQWILSNSLSNNDSKATPCFQGDIFGDWREEVVARTADGDINIYTSAIPTNYRIPTLLSDKQYRNAMVWQMNGYNQPPAVSYFLGELEGITVAPPTETNNGREEVSNGGTVGTNLNNKVALMAETNNMTATVANGAAPKVFIDNAPSWVQGNDDNNNITYTYYTHTLTGGAFGGATHVVKQGDGTLVMPNVTETYTGNTDVWAGTLSFDGVMQNSPLWLNRLTTLNSNGGDFQKGIKADYGATINVGGTEKKGTIKTTTLNLGFGSILSFKVYSDGTCDQLTADKVTLEKKDWQNGPKYNAPVIKINFADTATPGTYTLANITSLEGDIKDVKVIGLEGHKGTLSYENGELKIVIADTRASADVKWTGATDGNWDLANTENFSNGGDADVFVSGDNVTFDDDATTTNVTIDSNVSPKSVTFSNSSKAYTLNGEAGIAGTSSITKNGSADVTINNTNTFAGTVVLNDGTMKVAALGQSSGVNNGAFGVYTNDVTLNGGTLEPTANITSGHKLTLGSKGGTINVPENVTLTQSGAITGVNNTLTKEGAGQLTLPTNVSFSKLVINGGTVQGNESGSTHAYPKTIVLNDGATLRDRNSMNSYSSNYADIEVPEGATATWYTDERCNYKGSVSGAGTLNQVIIGNRVYLSGSYSGFTGTLKLSGQKGTYDPNLEIHRSLNLKNAIVSINVPTDNKGHDIKIGELKGNASLKGAGTWIVGGLGSDANLNAVIDGGKLTKEGDGVLTLGSQMPKVSGAVNVFGGVLNLTNNSKSNLYFGDNDVSVSDGGTIAGVGYIHAINVGNGGTIYPGNYKQAVKLGQMTTQSGIYCYAGSTAKFFVRHNVYKNFRGSSLKVGATLQINGDIVVEGYNLKNAKDGEEFTLWTAQDFSGTPTNITLPELPAGLYWDTSSLLKPTGVLKITSTPTGISNISADAKFTGRLYTVDGKYVGQISTTKATAADDIMQLTNQTGVYVIRVNGDGMKIVVK